MVDGIDSLNKTAFFDLVEKLGFGNLVEEIVRDKEGDFYISEDEKDLIELITKLYSLFGLPKLSRDSS